MGALDDIAYEIRELRQAEREREREVWVESVNLKLDADEREALLKLSQQAIRIADVLTTILESGRPAKRGVSVQDVVLTMWVTLLLFAGWLVVMFR